jgi:hypothetical protein
MIEGDLLSNIDPDLAYQAYQEAISSCKNSYPFAKTQNSS